MICIVIIHRNHFRLLCIDSAIFIFYYLHITTTGMCPMGDDPLTVFTDYRSIIIDIAAYYASFTGSFKFTFMTQSLSIPASGWDAQSCQNAFEALPNIDAVRCSISYSTTRYGGFTILIEFISFPVLPYMNNIFYHEGNPPISSFSCDTSAAVTTGSVTCKITDVSYNSLPGKKYK